MTVNDWPERKWTLGLRHLPASDADGDRGYDGAVEYELICRYCGDDPGLRYGEVSAELQQIRGPYQVKAGIEAFIEHDRSHEPAAGEAAPLLAARRGTWLRLVAYRGVVCHSQTLAWCHAEFPAA